MTAALATDRLPERPHQPHSCRNNYTTHAYHRDPSELVSERREEEEVLYWQPVSSKFEVLGARFDADAIDRHK